MLMPHNMRARKTRWNSHEEDSCHEHGEPGRHHQHAHSHEGSEQFGGGEDAAGMHFVHVKDGTTADLLVVGVLSDATEYGTNLELAKIWEVLGAGETTTTESFTTAVYDILPANPSFTHFHGSLTTPPCAPRE